MLKNSLKNAAHSSKRETTRRHAELEEDNGFAGDAFLATLLGVIGP